MAQSIRVTDRLYEEASVAAGFCQRSLAQQVEYWARIGMATEASGLTHEGLLQLLLGAQHVKDRQQVAEGEMKASALFAVGRGQAVRAKVKFRRIDLDRAADDYR